MKIMSSLLAALALLLGSSAMAAHPHKRVKRFVRRHPKVKAKVKEKYDKNDDGKLGPRERAKAHKDLHEKVKERRENVKDKFDENDDGKLSKDERANLREAAKKFHHHKHFEAWRKNHPKLWAKIKSKYDADGDGKLNEAERNALQEACQERREEIKDKFDEDDDGKLSADERANLREAVKKFHHHKHFVAWKKSHPKLWAKIKNKYDADGDGKLSEAERNALQEACQERRDEIKDKREERREKWKARREKVKARREARAGGEGGDDTDF